jgi:hypothetical protein
VADGQRRSDKGSSQSQKAEAMIAATVPVGLHIPLLAPGFGGQPASKSIGIAETSHLNEPAGTPKESGAASSEALSQSQHVLASFEQVRKKMEAAKKSVGSAVPPEIRSLRLAQHILQLHPQTKVTENQQGGIQAERKEAFKGLSQLMTELFLSSEKAAIPFSTWDDFQRAIKRDIPFAPQVVPIDIEQLTPQFASDYEGLMAPTGRAESLENVNLNHPFYHDELVHSRPYVYLNTFKPFSEARHVVKVRSDNARLIGLAMQERLLTAYSASSLLNNEASWLSGKPHENMVLLRSVSKWRLGTAPENVQQDDRMYSLYQKLSSHPSLPHIPKFQGRWLSEHADDRGSRRPYRNLF